MELEEFSDAPFHYVTRSTGEELFTAAMAFAAVAAFVLLVCLY